MLRHPAGILMLLLLVHAIATVVESTISGTWSIDRVRGWVLLPALAGGIAAAVAAGPRRGPLALVAEFWALLAVLAAANHARLIHKWMGDGVPLQQATSAGLGLALLIAAILLCRARPRAEEGDWHRSSALVGAFLVLIGVRGTPATRRGLTLAGLVLGAGLLMSGLQTADQATAFGRRLLAPEATPTAPPTTPRFAPAADAWPGGAEHDASRPTPASGDASKPTEEALDDDAAEPAPWILPAPERRLGPRAPRVRAPADRVHARIAPDADDRIGPWAGLLTDRPLEPDRPRSVPRDATTTATATTPARSTEVDPAGVAASGAGDAAGVAGVAGVADDDDASNRTSPVGRGAIPPADAGAPHPPADAIARLTPFVGPEPGPWPVASPGVAPSPRPEALRGAPAVAPGRPATRIPGWTTRGSVAVPTDARPHVDAATSMRATSSNVEGGPPPVTPAAKRPVRPAGATSDAPPDTPPDASVTRSPAPAPTDAADPGAPAWRRAAADDGPPTSVASASRAARAGPPSRTPSTAATPAAVPASRPTARADWTPSRRSSPSSPPPAAAASPGMRPAAAPPATPSTDGPPDAAGAADAAGSGGAESGSAAVGAWADPRFAFAEAAGRMRAGAERPGMPGPAVLASAAAGALLLLAAIRRVAVAGRGGRVTATGTTGSG